MRMKKLDKIRENKKWILLGITLALFLMILLSLLENRISAFDNRVYQILSVWISEPMTKIATIITFFGSALALIIITIIVCLILAYKKQKYGKYIIINLVIATVCNQIIKFLVARPRPEGYRLVVENGYSFPSGHTMVSMAFYGFFIYLIDKKIKNPYIKWSSIILLTLLISAIGLSRIYLGVHFASDVLAGLCFSTSYLIIFLQIIKKKL